MRLLNILCALVFFLILVPITTVASAQSLMPATGSDTKPEATVKLPEPLSEEAARDLLSQQRRNFSSFRGRTLNFCETQF